MQSETLQPCPLEILKLLDAALDFDAQNGTDRQWSELLTQAINAQAVIVVLLEELAAVIASTREECARSLDGWVLDSPEMCAAVPSRKARLALLQSKILREAAAIRAGSEG